MSRLFSCSQARDSCCEAILVQVSYHEMPIKIRASGNDSEKSLMVPVAQRISTGASILFLPDGCNCAAALDEIKHPWAPESMSTETGSPSSSAAMTGSELRRVKVKVVSSI